MPANEPAERALLGALLHGGTAFDRIAPLISSSDFTRKEHRAIYSAVCDMEGKGVDLLTVRSKLDSTAEGIAEAGGVAYLAGLVDGVPDVAGAERYARLIADASHRRRAIVECRRLETAAFSGEPIADLAAAGALMFSDIAATRDDGPIAVREVGRRTMQRLEMRLESGLWLTGVASGLPRLDELTLGLQRGVETAIGARARVGKTALALALALNAVQRGLRVMFVELDMSESMFGDRLLASVAGVSSFRIRSGRGLSESEIAQTAKASAQIASYGDALLFEHRARDVAKIAAYVRRASRTGGIDLVVIDHIGHVRGGKGEKRYLEVGDVSARLIELAGETNAAVVSLVQLNREAEHRAPLLSDLRESGNLEQDARLVILLDRPSLRGEGVPDCQLNVIVAKNEGETKSDLTAHFDLRTQRVTEEAEGVCRYCAGASKPLPAFSGVRG